MEKIFIGGIQGTGKTSLIKELIKRNNNIGIFSFGEEIQNMAQNQIGYKGIHLLSDENRKKIVDNVNIKLKGILFSQEFDKLLFDNHFTVVRNNIITPAFSEEKIKMYDSIIILSSSIEDIIARVLEDKEKERVPNAGKKEFIQKHQGMEWERALELSRRFNIPLLNIDNKEFKETVEKAENFIYYK